MVDITDKWDDQWDLASGQLILGPWKSPIFGNDFLNQALSGRVCVNLLEGNWFTTPNTYR